MKRLLATAVVGMLIAVAIPAQAAESTFDRNVQFLLEMAGFDDFPNEVVPIEIDGQITYMTGREVFEYAAAMTGDIDLAAMAETALPGAADAGTMYVLSTGQCAFQTADANLRGVGATPQAFVFGGDAGQAQCSNAYSYNYMTKTPARWPTLIIVGVIYCIHFWWYWICIVTAVVIRDP